MGDALSIRESEGIRAEEELTCVAVASKAPGTGSSGAGCAGMVFQRCLK